ncbi:MAG: hypothetical protein ACRCTQ_01400 [Brevinemataceae bacterium]
MKKLLLLFLILNVSALYSQEKDKIKGGLLGGWVAYEQHLGGLNNQFITYSGVTTAISILGFSLGVAAYGNLPFSFESDSIFFNNNLQILYGGIVIGYKTPWKTIGVRISTIIGAGSIKSWNNIFEQTYQNSNIHFVVSPTINLDFHLFSTLVLSVGVSYRYFLGAEDKHYFDINNWKNALSGVISLGWVY